MRIFKYLIAAIFALFSFCASSKAAECAVCSFNAKELVEFCKDDVNAKYCADFVHATLYEQFETSNIANVILPKDLCYDFDMPPQATDFTDEVLTYVKTFPDQLTAKVEHIQANQFIIESLALAKPCKSDDTYGAEDPRQYSTGKKSGDITLIEKAGLLVAGATVYYRDCVGKGNQYISCMPTFKILVTQAEPKRP